jgi:hypothetical protein
MINLRDLLILNLTLQLFDGPFSYQVFSLGAAEANRRVMDGCPTSRSNGPEFAVPTSGR